MRETKIILKFFVLYFVKKKYVNKVNYNSKQRSFIFSSMNKFVKLTHSNVFKYIIVVPLLINDCFK